MRSTRSLIGASIGLALAAVLALSGCSTPAVPGAPAELVPSADCVASALRSQALLGAPTTAPDAVPAPTPGTVPEGFEPVQAVLCGDGFGETVDVDGVLWQGVREQRLDGDFGGLIAALAVASDSRSTGPCTADFEIVPDLWLVADSGEAILVSWPVDGCGKTKPGMREALAGLATIDERVLPVAPAPQDQPLVLCNGLSELPDSGGVVPEVEMFEFDPSADGMQAPTEVSPSAEPGSPPFDC